MVLRKLKQHTSLYRLIPDCHWEVILISTNSPLCLCVLADLVQFHEWAWNRWVWTRYCKVYNQWMDGQCAMQYITYNSFLFKTRRSWKWKSVVLLKGKLATCNCEQSTLVKRELGFFNEWLKCYLHIVKGNCANLITIHLVVPHLSNTSTSSFPIILK